MSDQSSSTSSVPQAPQAAPVATGEAPYNVEEVRALREQGVAAEKADKWDEAAELYSHALELCCPDLNDRDAIVALGFDSLLANLLYLYGTALLYTYTQSSDMFGDKAEDEVKKRAVEMSADKDAAVEAMLDRLMGPRPDDDLDGEGEEGEEFGEDDGLDGEDEEIDADEESMLVEALVAAANGTTAENKETEEEEEKGEKKKEEEDEGDAQKEEEGEGDEHEDAEAGEEGKEGEDANGEAGAEGEKKEDEMNDLELAWQVLEISRFLYSTQSDRSLELSDVHFSLGNVAWEDEKQDEAKAEFEKALTYAETAKDRRAQAQVLLMLSSIHETKGQTEDAAKALERAKTLLREEITKIRAVSPKDIAIEILESSIKEMDDRIFALHEKFTPNNPDDVKDLPDPSKGPLTFSFTAPTIKSSSGPAEEGEEHKEGAAPVNVLQPKKKVPKQTSAAAPVAEESEGRGQKRAAEDPIPDQDQVEPQVKRAKEE